LSSSETDYIAASRAKRRQSGFAARLTGGNSRPVTAVGNWYVRPPAGLGEADIGYAKSFREGSGRFRPDEIVQGFALKSMQLPTPARGRKWGLSETSHHPPVWLTVGFGNCSCASAQTEAAQRGATRALF